MGFSRQEYWSGLPFPPPEESSRPRDPTHISCVTCTAGSFFAAEPLGKPSIAGAALDKTAVELAWAKVGVLRWAWVVVVTEQCSEWKIMPVLLNVLHEAGNFHFYQISAFIAPFSSRPRQYCMMCGILALWPGIRLVPWKWKHGVPTTGPPGKSKWYPIGKGFIQSERSVTLIEDLPVTDEELPPIVKF